MELNSNVFKFKYNGEDVEIREPSSREHLKFVTEYQEVEKDPEKALNVMQDFYVSLGLDKNICESMPLRVLAEVGKLVGGEEKK